MFEEADNFADLFRGGLPYYLLITLPILIICSSPVLATNEFYIQRMSQFDLHGVSYGCRASALNLEAKSLYTWSTSRHCVMARLQDLTIDIFREIRVKAGGLIVLLPENISKLSMDEKQTLLLLEKAMMSATSSIPIYFSKYNIDLNKIIDDITNLADKNRLTNNQESALTEIINSVSANGYQVVVSSTSHAINKFSKIPIVQGDLVPLKYQKPIDNEDDNTLPAIVITANINTFGLYNDYINTADVAVLFTIADVFSKLHNTNNAAPKYRLMFLISESGQLLNFQGTKKWLEEKSYPQNADFILCLDTIAKPIESNLDTLYMHVSKPPKEGSAILKFYKYLEMAASKHIKNITIEIIHKKINLADVLLAWEHERFSMKRLPAFTLSNIKSYKDPLRTTVFKDNYNNILKNTQKSAKIIAEALAAFIYNIEDGNIFTGTMNISESMIKQWMHVKSALHNNDLKNGAERYLKNVKITYEKPDQKEPDFLLYEGTEATLNIYRVKPAVFDLFLTLVIAAYLCTVYLIIHKFPDFYTLVCKLSKNTVKVKSN